jgi:hypothetical protein
MRPIKTHFKIMYGKPSNTTLTASGEFFQVQRAALAELEKSGGCTIAAFNHNKRPTKGFAVAIAGNEERFSEFETKQCQAIHDYLIEKEKEFYPQGRFLGCWIDSEAVEQGHEKPYFLDVVQIVEDREEAIALGKANNQLAIFDLNEGKEIRLDV